MEKASLNKWVIEFSLRYWCCLLWNIQIRSSVCTYVSDSQFLIYIFFPNLKQCLLHSCVGWLSKACSLYQVSNQVSRLFYSYINQLIFIFLQCNCAFYEQEFWICNKILARLLLEFCQDLSYGLFKHGTTSLMLLFSLLDTWHVYMQWSSRNFASWFVKCCILSDSFCSFCRNFLDALLYVILYFLKVMNPLKKSHIKLHPLMRLLWLLLQRTLDSSFTGLSFLILLFLGISSF